MATKKTRIVTTPIDERETFVSLGRSFADSELSVEEKLNTLYALQKADTDIDRIIHLRGELPSEVQALEDDLAAVKAKQEHVNALIAEYNASIENNANDIVEFDAHIAKYKSQLDNITNSREYDSINKELENEGLLRQIADKHIGEARMAIAEKNNLLEELAAKENVLIADLAAKQEELEGIIESTASEEETLKAHRDACATKIDPRTMSAYEHIRASVRNHLAVVPIYNGDSCGGCFNTITPNRLIDIRSGKKLVICEYCGRIIVHTPGDDKVEGTETE
ncbi:MAG: C4-type zinc ribbon domain-containing protein [Bacteroidales bacterium]|nr:C4-type zinc ribbon domain-containing protein [Bacteroidales bacterium]